MDEMHIQIMNGARMKNRRNKTVRCLILACVLLLSQCPIVSHAWDGNVYSEAEQPVDIPEIPLYATAAVLMDADSGRVLYGKNQDTAMAMASTTKIMTCILVLENVSPEDVLTVSAYAASMPKVKL